MDIQLTNSMSLELEEEIPKWKHRNRNTKREDEFIEQLDKCDDYEKYLPIDTGSTILEESEDDDDSDASIETEENYGNSAPNITSLEEDEEPREIQTPENHSKSGMFLIYAMLSLSFLCTSSFISLNCLPSLEGLPYSGLSPDAGLKFPVDFDNIVQAPFHEQPYDYLGFHVMTRATPLGEITSSNVTSKPCEAGDFGLCSVEKNVGDKPEFAKAEIVSSKTNVGDDFVKKRSDEYHHQHDERLLRIAGLELNILQEKFPRQTKETWNSILTLLEDMQRENDESHLRIITALLPPEMNKGFAACFLWEIGHSVNILHDHHPRGASQNQAPKLLRMNADELARLKVGDIQGRIRNHFAHAENKVLMTLDIDKVQAKDHLLFYQQLVNNTHLAAKGATLLFSVQVPQDIFRLFEGDQRNAHNLAYVTLARVWQGALRARHLDTLLSRITDNAILLNSGDSCDNRNDKFHRVYFSNPNEKAVQPVVFSMR